MSRIDHLRVGRSAASGELPEQVLPDPSPGPTREAVVNRRVRTVLRRAILPTAAALEHVHDLADHAAIVFPLDAAHIRGQVRLNPIPVLIA